MIAYGAAACRRMAQQRAAGWRSSVPQDGAAACRSVPQHGAAWRYVAQDGAACRYVAATWPLAVPLRDTH